MSANIYVIFLFQLCVSQSIRSYATKIVYNNINLFE